MKNASVFAKLIISASLPGESVERVEDVGEAFLSELKKIMLRSNIESRKSLQRLSRIIYGEAVNLNYDICSNGESRLASVVCSDNDIVFDVGANHGAWTKAVLENCQNVKIHCFEIVPMTAKILSKHFAQHQQVTVVSCGLNDQEGVVEANYCSGHSELSGVYNVHSKYSFDKVRCKVTTGDKYCERIGIDRIRLLKVDCEGSEYDVLKGFGSLIRSGSIDVIQFEYGKANIMSRAFLRDIYAFLSKNGYAIGRLYPDGVDFKCYELEDEDFVGPNYIACAKSCSGLILKLQKFPKM